MAFSKIILNGVTQIDLTQDTTQANKTLQGYTGHQNDGTGFTGTYVPSSEPILQDKTVTPTKSTQTVQADSGYDGLDTVTVNPYVALLQSKTATPSTTQQVITADTSTTLVDSLTCSISATSTSQSFSYDWGNLTIGETYHVVGGGSVSGNGTSGTVTIDTDIVLGQGNNTIPYSGATRVLGTITVKKTGIAPGVTITFDGTNNSGSIELAFYGTYDGLSQVTVGPIPSEYIIPTGTKSITSNGTGIDVASYASVDVSVPSGGSTYQSKTVSITPTESAQTQTVSPDSGYDALSSVTVNTSAISSTYVGSGIDRRSSTDLTVSGATVTAPAGYYSAAASKSIASGSATTPSTTITANPTISVNTATGLITASTSASQNITPTVSAGYISNGTAGTVSVSGSATEQLSVKSSTDLTVSGATVTAPAGYYPSNASKSVASGTVTAPASISGTSASVSTGTNTITLSKTVSVTPSVSTAGYVSAGTAGNSAVSLTASVTTKAAATITPGTTNQTIAAGTYLTGAQTIAGDADLVGSNILSTANIFGVQGTVSFQTYYTGSSAPSNSVGVDGDVWLQT